ncbi:MAG: hypothetical protein ACRD0W_25370 [Acidimicrobiales bacterium]
MATPTPATADELLTYLRKTIDPADQPHVAEVLEAATEVAEAWVSKSGLPVGPIVVREFTDRVPADTGLLRLRRKPVQSVTSATRISDGLEFLTAALILDSVAGYAEGATEPIPDGDYDVVYEAGRNPVSTNAKRAVLMLAGHIWDAQQGPGPRRAAVGGQEDSGHRVGVGYLIPHRVAHLLQSVVDS